jgi:hypothetical protein
MLDASLDAWCASLVGLFFAGMGMVWVAFAIYDLFKKK